MMIRKMQLDDLPQVAAIEQSLFGDAWSEKAFRDTLEQEEADFIVAVNAQNEIIGYCGAYRALDEAEIVNEEKKNGVVSFILEVRPSNLSAHRCYQKLGFRTIGIRRDFYDCPKENALVMKMESISGDE